MSSLAEGGEGRMEERGSAMGSLPPVPVPAAGTCTIPAIPGTRDNAWSLICLFNQLITAGGKSRE